MRTADSFIGVLLIVKARKACLFVCGSTFGPMIRYIMLTEYVTCVNNLNAVSPYSAFSPLSTPLTAKMQSEYGGGSD